MKYLTLLLLLPLLACSDSDPCDPVNHTMKGQFMLVKAVGYQPTDVGGPNIDDPFIIEWVPHTYEHPDITGRLILGEHTLHLDVTTPLQRLHVAGSLVVLPATKWPYDDPDRIMSCWTNLETNRGKSCPEYPYTWIENTLKLEFWIDQSIDWELFWVRTPDP